MLTLVALASVGCGEGSEVVDSKSEVVGLPNIRLSSIARSTGDEFAVRVCNEGTAASGFFAVDVYSTAVGHGFYQAYSEHLAGLDAGQCELLLVPCSAFASGDCHDPGDILADADPDNLVVETSEVDNTLEVHLESLRNLAITAVSRSLVGYVVTACNVGEASVDWSELKIYQDSDLYGFYPASHVGLVQLAAGACHDEPVPCGYIGDGSCADAVNVLVHLDPNDMLRETDEKDNLLEVSFESERDLSAGSITRHTDGYRFEVCNTGSAPVEWAEVRVYSSSRRYGTMAVTSLGLPWLEAGACFEELVPCGYFGDGNCAETRSIIVDVDPSDQIDETSEANNLREVAFYTQLNLSPGEIGRDATSYRAEVCNTGSLRIEWSLARVYQQSSTSGFSSVYDFGVPGLDPGECFEELIPCAHFGQGLCAERLSLVLEVDAGSQLDETREDDNFGERPFLGGPSTGLPDHRLASITRSSELGYTFEVCNDGHEVHPTGLIIETQASSPGQSELWPSGTYWVSAVAPGHCELVSVPCGAFGYGTCEDVLSLRAQLLSVDSALPADDEPSNDAIMRSFFERPDHRVGLLSRDPVMGYLIEICNEGSSMSLDGILLELHQKSPFDSELNPGGVYFLPPTPPQTCEAIEIPCGVLGDGTCEDVLTVRTSLLSVQWGQPLDYDASNDTRIVYFLDQPDHRVAFLERDPAEGYVFRVCNDGPSMNLDGCHLELQERSGMGYEFEHRGSYFVPPTAPLGCQDISVPCGTFGNGSCEDVLTVRARLRSVHWNMSVDQNRANDAALVSWFDRPDHRIASIRRDAALGYEIEVCNDGPSMHLDGIQVELMARADGHATFTPAGAGLMPPLVPHACDVLVLPCGMVGDGTCEDRLMLRAGLQSAHWNQRLDNNPHNDFALAPFDLPDSPRVAAEIGAVLANQPKRSAWAKVALVHEFDDPVVVMSTLSYGDKAPAHARARKVAADGFEWQIEEWDYLDGKHGHELVPYMVVESGRHTLAEWQVGTLEAGKTLAGHAWVQVLFSEPFPAPPVILTGVMSENDARAVVVRMRNVTSYGFEIAVQEAEGDDGLHAPETIGWVATLAGVRDVAGMVFDAGSTGLVVTDAFSPLNFSAPFTAPPIVLASIATTHGSDTAGLRLDRASGADTVLVKVEEEKSRDRETSHVAEDVAWLAFGEPGLIYSR